MEQAVDISRGVIKLSKRHLPRCDRVSRRVLQSSDCGDEPIGCIRLAFNSFNLFIPFEEPIAIASSFERKEKKGKERKRKKKVLIQLLKTSHIQYQTVSPAYPRYLVYIVYRLSINPT